MKEDKPSARVFLGLGSNLGNREVFIASAVKELESVARVLNVSSLYETEPVGMKPTGPFLNAAVEVEAGLDPEILLLRLQEIEKKLGRSERTHLQPREIDIDLLIYGSLVLNDKHLRVPHPGLRSRRFVLSPLAEIAADIVDPVTGATIAELLMRCPDHSRVVRTQASVYQTSSS